MKRVANLLLGALLVAGAATLSAQDQGQGGRRGNFDPAEMRERMMRGFKESLGASDEEWKAIQPRLEKVMEKQRGVATGGGFMAMGGFGGRRGGDGGPGGGGRGGRAEASFPEADALRQAIESGTTEEIKTKLAAFREARKKREAELRSAREDLRKIVSVKQEAALVARGILD